MYSVKRAYRRWVALFLLILISFSSVKNIYATEETGMESVPNPYSIEIIPSEKNSYAGESQADFDIKISYEGEEAVPEETLQLKAEVSDQDVIEKNSATLPANRKNSLAVTKESGWVESYSLYLPVVSDDRNVSFTVTLMDENSNTLLSETCQFPVKKTEEEIESAAETTVEEDEATADETAVDETTADANQPADEIQNDSEQKAERLDYVSKYARFNAKAFTPVFDSSVLPQNPGNGKNQWQVMQGTYAGRYQEGDDVSEEFDTQTNAAYSGDNAIRMTKNVISTDIENEFLMYLNVEPQVSWQEIMKLNTIIVANNNALPDGTGYPNKANCSQLLPEPTVSYDVPVKITYYYTENGRRVDLATVTMYANTNKVPNGSIGIGNLLFGENAFYSANQFNLVNGETEIDITNLHESYDFSTGNVKGQSVTDQLGEHIKLKPESFNYDGGSVETSGDVIHWNLPTDNLGDLSFESKDLNGVINVTPKNVVKRTLRDGKITYYRQETYRMSYGFSLRVTDKDFVSSALANSNDDTKAEYAVQTNKSPDDPSDTIKGGQVTYQVGTDTGKTGDFNSPYIKGLLYNVEFQKFLEGSKIPLSGIKFELNRITNGNSYSEQIQCSKSDKTDGEGRIKFHDLPWGQYEITEVSFNENDSFQKNYIQETLPKEIETVSIGKVINENALKIEHGGIHTLDAEKDQKNQLFLFQDGEVENTPYRAKVTIKKTVNSYANLSPELQNQIYTMKLTSSDVYLKPSESQRSLDRMDEMGQIKHEETLTYEVIVPKDGGTISLEEAIPDAVKDSIVYGRTVVTKNAGSTEIMASTPLKQGCSLKVMPGNDVTICVENDPVGTIRIKKEIDNYQECLKDDEFMVQVSGAGISSEVVLKNGETSGAILIKESGTVYIDEIVPMEYTFERLTIEREGSETSGVSGNSITVQPGSHITVVVHNNYQWKPYFHAFDSVRNLFGRGQ